MTAQDAWSSPAARSPGGRQRSEWTVVPLRRPLARVRLYCLPWAGAGAAGFRDWARGLPEWVEVVAVALPGRERRLAEPALDSVRRIADRLAPVLLADAGELPQALFGHSLGALVAHETALRLTAAGAGPELLVVSGSRAPHLPVRGEELHRLPDDASFLRALRRLQPPGDAVLDHPELVSLLLPALLADFTAAETHHRPARADLACPITALYGTDDPLALRSDLDAWGRCTTGGHSVHEVPGGHLFVMTHQRRVLNSVTDALRRSGREHDDHDERGTT
ncbi:thioesterase domain-containing protein [Streptomyces sp. NPDC046870]|uniref:thioesterase II family protein n=1 Tax=Streptomyces sp. NPDC046870 TaxID=3155135 RepID=UPI0034548BA1